MTSATLWYANRATGAVCPAQVRGCRRRGPAHRAGARRRGQRAGSEPASHKDRTLLRLSPHLVLDGLQTAASALGAGEAYLAVEDGTSWLEAALADRHDPLPVTVVRLPRAGSSSARPRP